MYFLSGASSAKIITTKNPPKFHDNNHENYICLSRIIIANYIRQAIKGKNNNCKLAIKFYN
jgi:hypothetical protein